MHFPIALWFGGVLTLIAFGVTADLFWYRATSVAYIAGGVFAALAAVPGLVDLFGGIPPGTDARSTGLKHMALNLAALVIFVWIGVSMDRALAVHVATPLIPLSVTLPVVMSIVGAVALAVSGALGSKLVYKRHVGQQIDSQVGRPNVQPRSGTFAHNARRTAH